jgi:hypothetical protein
MGCGGGSLEYIPEKLHDFSDKNMRKNKQIERFEWFSLNEKRSRVGTNMRYLIIVKEL